ncbi:antibiotic biosynthesis monooxygenase [Paenibacillus sp. CMAA1364]
MLIQTRTIHVEKGNVDQVVERFSGEKPVDKMKGLIDRTVMVNRRNKEYEEIIVMIRWESEEAWKNWEKSDVHIQGHRDNRGKTPPEYVISTTVHMYDVKNVKQGES